MVQRHSIMLWRVAENSEISFENISKETYNVLNIFQQYPKGLRPNFLTGKSKKNVKEFEWNYDNFSKELRRGVNKEGGQEFEHLGYSISFFSSKHESESCSFDLNVGNKNEKFYNTIVVKLPLDMNLYDKEKAKDIVILFKKLCDAYTPLWGCVSNQILSRQYNGFFDNGLPTTVHWLNYWSNGIVNRIGEKKMVEILKKNPSLEFQENILILNETAFNMDIIEDVELQKKYHKNFFEK